MELPIFVTHTLDLRVCIRKVGSSKTRSSSQSKFSRHPEVKIRMPGKGGIETQRALTTQSSEGMWSPSYAESPGILAPKGLDSIAQGAALGTHGILNRSRPNGPSPAGGVE